MKSSCDSIQLKSNGSYWYRHTNWAGRKTLWWRAEQRGSIFKFSFAWRMEECLTMTSFDCSNLAWFCFSWYIGPLVFLLAWQNRLQPVLQLLTVESHLENIWHCTSAVPKLTTAAPWHVRGKACQRKAQTIWLDLNKKNNNNNTMLECRFTPSTPLSIWLR